ncbi:hypothetical protein PMAYCL1PPCAC_05579, partial [Pristionchus mayeri]
LPFSPMCFPVWEPCYQRCVMLNSEPGIQKPALPTLMPTLDAERSGRSPSAGTSSSNTFWRLQRMLAHSP